MNLLWSKQPNTCLRPRSAAARSFGSKDLPTKYWTLSCFHVIVFMLNKYVCPLLLTDCLNKAVPISCTICEKWFDQALEFDVPESNPGRNVVLGHLGVCGSLQGAHSIVLTKLSTLKNGSDNINLDARKARYSITCFNSSRGFEENWSQKNDVC